MSCGEDDGIGRSIVAGEELHEAAFGAGRDLREGRRLAAQLDRIRIRHVELGAMQANVAANLPGQQRMLVGRIVADQQDRRRVGDVAHRSRCVWLARQRRGEGREVGGAVVVDVVGAQHQPRELLQQVIFFVAGVVGADDADRRSDRRWSSTSLNLVAIRSKACSQVAGDELAVALDQRLLQAFADCWRSRRRSGP